MEICAGAYGEEYAEQERLEIKQRRLDGGLAFATELVVQLNEKAYHGAGELGIHSTSRLW